MTESADVLIIGGGIAGLTTAWRLRQQRPDVQTVVLEADERPGGKIQTEILDHEAGRFLIELGPDSMLDTAKPWARQLCNELGMDNDVVAADPSPQPTAIWCGGQAIDLPLGLTMLAPTQPEPFLASPLLTPAGRQRALQEPEVPVRTGSEDESLGAFVTRRFGSEYLEAIAEPLLAGIYNADPFALGLQASFPNLRTLELEYGSVIRGAEALARPVKGSPFFSLRAGLAQLPATLSGRLGSAVRTGQRVERLDRTDAGAYAVTLQTGARLTAQQVVVTTPVSVARALLTPVAPATTPIFDRLRHSSSGAIVVAWPDRQIGRPLRGYGLVVPRRESEPFNAVTVSSRKYSGRAPAGWTLLRFFFGGYRSPQTLALDDEALLGVTCDFAARTMGVTGAPGLVRITRWNEGSPIYQVGHLETVEALETALPPGLFLAGAAYRGPGIPDTVRSAGEVANRIAMPEVVAAL